MSSSDPLDRPHVAGVALQGDLGWVHVSGVLHALEVDRLAGWLELPGGRLAVRDGQLCEVCMGDATGVDALLEVIGLDAGVFQFHPGTVDAPVTGPISATLVRCGQALDDWWSLGQRCVRVRPEARGAHPVLLLLDGSRTVAEAVLELGQGLVVSVEAVSDALAAGDAVVVEEEADDDAGRLADLALTEEIDLVQVQACLEREGAG